MFFKKRYDKVVNVCEEELTFEIIRFLYQVVAAVGTDIFRKTLLHIYVSSSGQFEDEWK